VIKVEHIRSSFFDIVNFLNDNNFDYWVGHGLAEQISEGIIRDDDEKHDIDFHILSDDHLRLRRLLDENNYKVTQDLDYKIQILGKRDNRRIEFVFLFSEGDFLSHQSKKKKFRCQKSVFDKNKEVLINKIKVKIPDHLSEYVRCLRSDKKENKLAKS
jgi:hypothetical protein